MKEAIYMMLYTVVLAILVSFAVATVIWLITKILEWASSSRDEQAEMALLDEELALVLAIAHSSQKQ